MDKDSKPSISNSLVHQFFVHQFKADRHAILVGTQNRFE